MKLKYENLEDAKQKLLGTYCLYKKRALTVRTLTLEENGTYTIGGMYMSSGRSVCFKIDDPEFNCSNYNIGYLNLNHSAAWFYRIPYKQYRQGLRHDQVRMRYSSPAFAGIHFQGSKAVGAMLENDYPQIVKAVELLQNKTATIVAFHKNFALTYDEIHKDFIIEYKGVNIGFSHNIEKFSLLDEHKHLTESLKEAMN